MTDWTTLRIVLAGAGHVGSGLLRLLNDHAAHLLVERKVLVEVVAVVEAGGAVSAPGGLDLTELLPASDTETVANALPAHPHFRAGVSVADILSTKVADVYVEATPLNIEDAQPALDHIRQALRHGWHVVSANKGPLALAFTELSRHSDLAGSGPCLRFSACVAGALPVLSVGRRDLGGEPITGFAGVLNGTSYFVLRQMAAGRSYDEAITAAQRMGIAETDPSLDVDGWDAACKLTIVANMVLGQPCELRDVSRRGIDTVTVADLEEAAASGETILPLARMVQVPARSEPTGSASADLIDSAGPWGAEAPTRTGGPARLDVGPVRVPVDHPLAGLRPSQMGVVFSTKAVPELVLTSDEPSALPAAAALLRDLVDIHRIDPARSQLAR